MDLSEIFVTKMCHDLAGTIGTLKNSSELLIIDPGFANDGANLIKDASSILVSRLKFFRALLGTASPITYETALDYVQTLPMPLQLVGNISSKLHLVLVLFGCEILVRGGTIDVSDGCVICSGPQINLDETKKQILEANYIEEKPSFATVLWLQNYAQQNGFSIELFSNESVLTLKFSKSVV